MKHNHLTMDWDNVKTWDIYSIGGYIIETVFFDKNMSVDEVKKELIEKDGFLPNIHIVAR